MSNLTQMKPAFPDDLSLTRSDCLSPDHRSEVNTPDLSLQSSNRTSVTPVRFPSLLPFPAQREIGNPLHQLTNPVALPFRDLSLPFWLDTIRIKAPKSLPCKRLAVIVSFDLRDRNVASASIAFLVSARQFTV
jgi:hypothetical protein